MERHITAAHAEQAKERWREQRNGRNMKELASHVLADDVPISVRSHDEICDFSSSYMCGRTCEFAAVSGGQGGACTRLLKKHRRVLNYTKLKINIVLVLNF
jgi:hypothetical protein